MPPLGVTFQNEPLPREPLLAPSRIYNSRLATPRAWPRSVYARGYFAILPNEPLVGIAFAGATFKVNPTPGRCASTQGYFSDEHLLGASHSPTVPGATFPDEPLPKPLPRVERPSGKEIIEKISSPQRN